MAGKICPTYPDIERMTACLDIQELSHATTIRQMSLGQALTGEVQRLTAFVAASCSMENKVDITRGTTPAMIVYLLTAVKGTDIGTVSPSSSVHVGNTDLHMDDEESGEEGEGAVAAGAGAGGAAAGEEEGEGAAAAAAAAAAARGEGGKKKIDERISTAGTADSSLTAEEAMVQLIQALPQPSLLLMARKMFYEGQNQCAIFVISVLLR